MQERAGQSSGRVGRRHGCAAGRTGSEPCVKAARQTDSGACTHLDDRNLLAVLPCEAPGLGKVFRTAQSRGGSHRKRKVQRERGAAGFKSPVRMWLMSVVLPAQGEQGTDDGLWHRLGLWHSAHAALWRRAAAAGGGGRWRSTAARVCLQTAALGATLERDTAGGGGRAFWGEGHAPMPSDQPAPRSRAVCVPPDPRTRAQEAGDNGARHLAGGHCCCRG